jgi:hypothetical protein
MEDTGKKDKTLKILRKAARGLSIFIILIALFILFGNIFGDETEIVEEVHWLEYLTVGIMFLCALSLALAWCWEILAGALNIGFFVIVNFLYWLVNDRLFPLPAFLTLGIAIIPGIIFLALGIIDKKSVGEQPKQQAA